VNLDVGGIGEESQREAVLEIVGDTNEVTVVQSGVDTFSELFELALDLKGTVLYVTLQVPGDKRSDLRIAVIKLDLDPVVSVDMLDIPKGPLI
jgi:hypothetical protein